MSYTKMLTRGEIEAIRARLRTFVAIDEMNSLCATALHYMAEVERLRPVVEAAREDFKFRVWQMICDLSNDREFDDTKMAAITMEEMQSVLDRAFEALEEAEGNG